MNYFTIRVTYTEKYPDEVTWYNLFADIYGMKTTCYDGYVRDIQIVDEKTVELSCYLVDDPKKLEIWKESYGSRWIIEQLEAIRRSVLNHSLGIQAITIHEHPSLSPLDISPSASSCDQVA